MTFDLLIKNNPHLKLIFQQLQNSESHDPHALLGLHKLPEGGKIIRLWRPGAQVIYIEMDGESVPMQKVHHSGIFELKVPENTTHESYWVFHHSGRKGHDPYAFLPTLGDVDEYLFGKSTHYQLYNILGAQYREHQGVTGVSFTVWAPAAKRVSVVGDFNHWDGRVNPMRSMGSSGLWELFIPGIQLGDKYKYEIKTSNGVIKVKSDPIGFSSELRPATASVVADLNKFQWSDQDWISLRNSAKDYPKPINVYELHLGSWRKKDGHFLNYRELAEQLAQYCIEMGFTHVELLPIQEHPLDESWGYQVSGFYAVTSRFGTPEDFQWFVNHLHKNKIGVILDWVPGHFPTDDFSLARFDGTALYEHEDPRQGFHPHWNTLIFNFGRYEVANFLIANALYWFDKFHVDGLRVDAVASILYLDYGRESGEWIPNKYGGKENLEAIEFFKHLNSISHKLFPGILMIAEESTAFTGITHSVDQGGLGFDMKWNMGWMNDTLRYMSKDMIFRHYHHNDLTFGLLYAFSEKFLLALSHDEVVHGKRSLLDKMPGDLWQKFANLRLLFGYQICQPGKKLIFMGAEIGQWNEWWCKGELEWYLLRYPLHHGVQTLVKELNHFYHSHSALWEKDFDYTGFEWVDFADTRNSTISYLRKSDTEQLLCVHNFTPNFIEHYFLPVKNIQSIREIFNSDEEKYGGSGKTNPRVEIVKEGSGYTVGAKIHLSPLATLIFEIKY